MAPTYPRDATLKRKDYVPTTEDVSAVFYYDEDMGALFRHDTGALARTPHFRGYWQVSFDCRTHLEHRLIWVLANGVIPDGYTIDHKNGDRKNNRIENLRLATREEQLRNIPPHKDNKTGLKGVMKSNNLKKVSYFATIRVNKKNLYLGRYATPEEAHAAYCEAAHKHFGEFARTK